MNYQNPNFYLKRSYSHQKKDQVPSVVFLLTTINKKRSDSFYTCKFLKTTIILKLLIHKISMDGTLQGNLSSVHQDNKGNNLSQSSSCLSKLSNYEAKDKIQQFVKTAKNLNNLIKITLNNSERAEKNLTFQFCSKYKNWNLPPATVSRYLDRRIEKMLKSKRIKQNWNNEDILLLIWVLEQYCSLGGIDSIQQINLNQWDQIAQCIPGTTGQSCMFRILRFKKTRLTENQWSLEQEDILNSIVEPQQNKNWKLIAQRLYKLNTAENKIFRNAKQCKEHWNCYLNPTLKKGPWDITEDIKLLENIYRNNGNKNWAKMVKTFNGRTQNAIKNRFSFLLGSDSTNSNISESEMSRISELLKNYKIKENDKKKLLTDEPTIKTEVKGQKIVAPSLIPTSLPQNQSNLFPPGIIPIFYQGSPYFFVMNNQCP